MNLKRRLKNAEIQKNNSNNRSLSIHCFIMAFRLDSNKNTISRGVLKNCLFMLENGIAEYAINRLSMTPKKTQ